MLLLNVWLWLMFEVHEAIRDEWSRLLFRFVQSMAESTA